jgi:protein-tyrosine phosphatase
MLSSAPFNLLFRVFGVISNGYSANPLLTDLRIYRHVDLYYEDGGNPTEEILQAFLQICETERGAIAVHCKAGLGRTGTNIAAYMIKHYGYTAKETMAWCR